MTTAMVHIPRSRARHIALIPKGKGILERLFGFTPKPRHRRETFVKA